MRYPGVLEDYRWLVSDDAAEWLRRAGEDAAPSVACAARLRKNLSAERAGLVLDQLALRRRAREKFPHAGRGFFTRVALEQASDWIVAAYKASRLPAGAPVADLCCGIGGDLAALAERGAASGVDRDEIAALLAEANLHTGALTAAGLPPRAPARVVVADAADFRTEGYAAWHLDPDRRPHGRRTTSVELHEPGPVVIERLRHDCPAGAVKLAPAAVIPADWAAAAEQEWISCGRECRQLVTWFGPLAARPGSRRATVLGARPGEVRTVDARPEVERIDVRPVGRYVYEPDAAVLAAGLADSLAAEHGLAIIAPQIAYFTAEFLVVDAALAAFEVEAVLPLDLKRLRKLLREHAIGRLEIKKRGVPHDPETLRRQLALRGEESAVLLVAPIGSTVTAIVARRAEPTLRQR